MYGFEKLVSYYTKNNLVNEKLYLNNCSSWNGRT